ncbi:hypothetical protein OF83DRAFT_1062507 [Amylostereum chailletii]|nr:hypothetical protein OF83DRAFT_1062507 [Amylostereum chailletii]
MLLLLISQVQAYIPAVATNDTNVAIAHGLNVTDTSKLYLQWFFNSSYSQTVSYQLVGSESNGISKGALVHFSEELATNDTTTTPWIALVSCDGNATKDSQVDDIFTLARDRGAVGALLYSLFSEACIINPEYADPNNFDQVMDIFSTQSLSSARFIESQFESINVTVFGSYNAIQMNNSQSYINDTVLAGYPTQPGYLWATLDAYNATGDPRVLSAPPSDPPGGGGSKKTNLAMIILYTITGCVSALFCAVIVTGAIRALRHPERYRRQNGRGTNIGGQSAGATLTRAILDTFPIIKFGSREDQAPNHDTEQHDKDVEAQAYPGRAVEMSSFDGTDCSTPRIGTKEENTQESSPSTGHTPRPVHATNPTGAGEDPMPDQIGRETCPICIVDFEEGDDLRVLPCEGHHRFHQSCVDPWLLELSTSCPICRHAFQVLQDIISGETEDGHERETNVSSSNRHPSAQGRFSRYLRFARRRQHPMDEPDPTDPPMPLAPASGYIA